MKHLFVETHRWEQVNRRGWQAIRVTRRMLLMTLVIVLYRLNETRERLLLDWLFSDAELRAMGFPRVDEIVGGKKNWSYFVILRGQYAAHAFSKKKTHTRPGRILNPRILGEAMRRTGAWESENFVKQGRELVPGIERVRDELARRYPEAKGFLTTYNSELEQSSQ